MLVYQEKEPVMRNFLGASVGISFSPQKVFFADYLGLVPYETAFELQQKLVPARAENLIPDVLLLLQHPPVFTLGRFRGEKDIVASPETLAREGITVFATNRGGSVTYHGPGQLIGYPIFNLKEIELGIREYIFKLEESIIKLLLEFGIQGRRLARYPGVWVGEAKIGSVGIHVSRYITMHGFALNVNPDLRHFEYINPCGIKSKAMTSLAKILGYPISVEDVIEPLLRCFSAVFGLDCVRDKAHRLAGH